MKTTIVSKVRNFSWQQWLVVALFLLVAGSTAFKVVHTVRDVIYLQTHRDEAIRGWMSIGYVAHSYRVPKDVLYQSLGLPQNSPNKRPLRKIANMQHRSMEEIRVALQNT